MVLLGGDLYTDPTQVNWPWNLQKQPRPSVHTLLLFLFTTTDTHREKNTKEINNKNHTCLHNKTKQLREFYTMRISLSKGGGGGDRKGKNDEDKKDDDKKVEDKKDEENTGKDSANEGEGSNS